jgi:Ca2+-binding EF-hand superfamily protein
MDDNRSGDLDLYEFKKAIKDFRVSIVERDVERLFNIFDRNRNGSIDYDEFLRGVRVRITNKIFTFFYRVK